MSAEKRTHEPRRFAEQDEIKTVQRLSLRSSMALIISLAASTWLVILGLARIFTPL